MTLRLLLVADPHISDIPPASRNDQYPLEVLGKLHYVIGYAAQRADGIVFTGDIFHRRSFNDYGLLVAIINMLNEARRQKLGFTAFSIVGNHDVSLRHSELNKQPFGLLVASGALVRIPSTGLLFGNVLLVGKDFERVPTPEYFSVSEQLDALVAQEVKWSVLVTHGNLVPTGFSAHGDFYQYAQLNPRADVLLNGHLHSGFPTMRHGRTLFINPGSIARISRDDHRDELRVILATFTNEEILVEDVAVPCAPYQQAFTDTVALVDTAPHIVDVDRIVSQLKLDVGHDTLESMDLDPDVKRVAMYYLDQAKT